MTVFSVKRTGGRLWVRLLFLLHLLLPLLLFLLHDTAAATGGDDDALNEEDMEQDIPFLAENWEISRKPGRRVLPPSPKANSNAPAGFPEAKTAATAAAATATATAAAATTAGGGGGGKGGKKRREKLLHALQQPPTAALQLLRGDSTLTTKRLEKERKQKRQQQLQRENAAMDASRQSAETRFPPEVDIAERQTKPFKPNRLKRLLKTIAYFLTSGGKLPDIDYWRDD
ncbi:hypothetical protein ACSSS7_008446 [Eimeria intestinalis]